MKTVMTTVRLPEKIMKILDKRAEEERLDRTAVMREFLEEAIMNWKIEKATELYKAEKTTISEAARIAELSVSEMMDELVKRGVKSNITAEEYKESLTNAFRLFGIKKKQVSKSALS